MKPSYRHVQDQLLPNPMGVGAMYHLYKGDIVGLSNRNTQAEESKGDSNKDVLGFGHDSVTLSDPHSERENQQTQKLRLKDTHICVGSHISSV